MTRTISNSKRDYYTTTECSSQVASGFNLAMIKVFRIKNPVELKGGPTKPILVIKRVPLMSALKI